MAASFVAPAPTDPRRAAIRQELDAVAARLLETELGALPEAHQTFARRMLEVADAIDALYAVQTGLSAVADRVPAEDVESRSVLRRNWGLTCRSPIGASNDACSPVEGEVAQPVAVYPAAMQGTEGFCQTLEARPDHEALLAPFVAVVEREGDLAAVPYHEAFAAETARVVEAVRRAADALADDASEEPLVTYLRAAATAFGTDDWEPADEAWASMNATNSRWYVRVGPDETYWEPCSLKAGYHLTLALINRDSLTWQERLTPLQGDMEAALAAISDGTYTAREVSFHMPDFIEIVVNAGDDRDAFGATIGQSLPNWGPVREEGRGRTVAMTNLYTDEDSQGVRRAMAESLFVEDALSAWSTSPQPGLVSTILHEATHNLGPASGYEHEGQTAPQAFGGELATMLEELKAQSGALFFLELITERGILDESARQEAILDNVVWALGHISRGMTTPSGRRRPYSQLAAIQVGYLLDAGVLTWDPQAEAANGEDIGGLPPGRERLRGGGAVADDGGAPHQGHERRRRGERPVRPLRRHRR
jgi:hypothetical protein